MIKLIKFLLASTFTLSVFLSSANAANQAYADLDMRYIKNYTTIKVHEDYTSIEEYETALEVLAERAIGDLKTTSISYSTSIEKLEILAAFTQKVDGMKIDVPQNNYQVKTNAGKDKNAPVFSDYTQMTIVFPEVEVGDVLVLYYRLTQTEPMFPGRYTSEGRFSKSTAFNDVSVTLEVPRSFDGQYQTRGMKETVSRHKNKTIYKWTYQNPQPKKNKRRNFSVYNPDLSPGYAYSTFANYQQIALAYGHRANPKARITKKIQQLANEIIQHEKDKREQARLLYEWVAKNISYAGNCIGVGAVVPHDLDFILSNRMGDCKDHATLLQALLSAKHIKNTQALINAGSIYQLPKIPMVNAVNHVINYLPEFDLFVDSTDDTMPFGRIGFSIADKPVLLVDNYQAGLRTPIEKPDNQRNTIDTVINIHDDGSASGEIDFELMGYSAIGMRDYFRNISVDDEERLIENAFRSDTELGKGSIKKDDPTALSDEYHFQIKFQKKDFVLADSAGAFKVSQLFPVSSINQQILAMLGPLEKTDITCMGGAITETYYYQFPDNTTLFYKPEDVELHNDHARYQSVYNWENNTLTVTRKFQNNLASHVCSPSVMQLQQQLAVQIAKNLKAQVLYKMPEQVIK